MSTTYSAYHLAARATPALIGRSGPLEQIKRAVGKEDKAIVYYVHAPGGIGKTRFVTEILQRCREGAWRSADKPLLTIKEPVDLYHFEIHSLEGIVRALSAVLPDEAHAYFAEYREQLARLERVKPDLRYAQREMTALRTQMAETFIRNFNQLTGDYRVVLAFDTAEMLVYETDEVQKMLGLKTEGIGVRPWLIEQWLPQLSNVVVLIAGREREQLRADLEKSLGNRLQTVPLGPFSLDETRAYFEQVTQAARDAEEESVAQRIEAIPDETRHVIHLYTGGRPILLALMIDLLALAERLPEEVKASLETAQETARSEEKLKQVQYALESNVVKQFQKFGSLADDAIQALAFARKGLSPTMLARILEISDEEAKEVLGALTGLSFNGETPHQNGIRPLSFIKVRPADRRVFLHDEMYDLMERHVLNNLPDPDVERVYHQILRWYGDTLADTRKTIQELEAQTRQEITLDRQIVTLPRVTLSSDFARQRAEAESKRNRLITEIVHYGLRQDTVRGFQAYCKYAEYAWEAGDESLDMQSRDELLAFVNHPTRQERDQIDGLKRSEVEADAGIRWIRRYIQHTDYASAIGVAVRLHTECADLLQRAGPLDPARADLWAGYAYGYDGRDLAHGEELLRQAITALHQSDLAEENGFHRWYRDLALANAYNGLGYVRRQRGYHRQSVAAYRRALPLWRTLGPDYKASHANTLNNLSWALAELGEYEDAFRFCRDSLALRQEEGARYPIALSYNTLGQIQTKADQPSLARINCERALAIFHELEMPRGIGMASVALAEACRRMGAAIEVSFPEEKAHLLWQAAQYADEAVRIFGGDPSLPEAERKPEVPELSRLVDALIEQGCAYREWARLRPHYTDRVDEKGEPVDEIDPDQDQLAHRSEVALREAARVAGDKQPHRAVDALVNLAWLEYFMGKTDAARQIIEQVWKAVPADYYITDQRGLPESEQDMPWNWVQISKAHRLQGDLAYDRYLRRDAEAQRARATRDAAAAQEHQERAYAHLREAVVQYTLAEAYDELYGRGQLHRDQKRSEEQIYERLKSLNVDELDVARVAIEGTARTYKLGDQSRMAELLEKWFLPPEGDMI